MGMPELHLVFGVLGAALCPVCGTGQAPNLPVRNARHSKAPSPQVR